MNSVKWFFACLFLCLLASPILAETYVLDGGSLSANLGPWAGQGFVYPLTFDVTAAGGIDIIYYDVDGAQMRFNNISYGGSLKGTCLTGVTSGTQINSIDPPNNSVWSNMLNQNNPSSFDWNGHATSTLGPDGVPLTIDDTRSWLFQSWYRQLTGGKTGHPGYGDPAFNTESYITPNPRFPSSPAHNTSFYNTYDMRIRITPNGGNNYTAERWVRMHNSAATVEGATWVYNTALNNSGDAWRRSENEMGIYTFPMTNLDLTAVHPFVAVANWETTSDQAVTWGSVVVTGTPVLQAEVWVDDAWAGLPNGTEVMLPNGQPGLVGYNAFSHIQLGVNAAAANGIVHVGAGNYYEQIAINKSISLLGAGEPTIHPPTGTHLTYSIPESGSRYDPILIAYGGTKDGSGNISGSGTVQVTISGLNIDGDNAATSTHYVAFFLRNCLASTISYNDIYEMLKTSGNPETFGMLIYGNSNITIDHNTVNDFSRNGITVNGDDGALPDPTAIISNNTVLGEGVLPIGYWAQNGIQIGWGASGSINGCEIANMYCSDPNWSASGLALMYPGPGITLTGNNVHNVQGGLNAYYSDNLVINGNNIFDQNDFIFVWGGANTTVNGNTFTNNGWALYYADCPTAVTNNNIFTGNDYSIIADGACTALSFSGNNITGSLSAAGYFQPYGASPVGVQFSGNNISGNAFGIYNATANMINAVGNWWGDATGPNEELGLRGNNSIEHPVFPSVLDQREQRHFEAAIKSNSSPRASGKPSELPIVLGNGDGVSALVDYSPWWGADYIGDDHASPWNWGLNNSNSSTIQEGINTALAHDIIQVYPGSFHEHVVLNKAITLTGDRGDIAVAGPGPSAPTLDGTGFSNTSAFLFNENVADITIEGFEIRNYGPNGNTDADAFVAWNSHTANITIRDNYMHHLGYAGVLIGNGWGGPQGLHDNWNVSYNVVSNFAGYGLDLENAQNSILSHNQVTSPTIITQGIMVVALADPGQTMVCSGNQVTDNQLIDFPDRGICLVTWANDAAASATITNTIVSGNVYTGNYNGISNWKLGPGTNLFSNLTMNNNSITVINPNAAGYAIDLSEVAGSNVFNNNTVTLTGALGPNATFFHGLNIGGAATGNLTFDNLQLFGNNLGASDVGIRLRNTLPATTHLEFNNCGITGFARGVRSDALTSGVVVSLYHSSIASNSEYGISNLAGAPIIAQNDWWGSYCGPFHSSTNPDGSGNRVSDNVTYDPWCDQTFTNCNFSNSTPPAVVWVDDDYTPTGANDGHYWCFDAFSNIQTAISEVAQGGTVNVLAGTYVAQIAINKSLNLIGTGNPVFECPAGPLTSYTISESAARFEPIVIAYGGTNDGSGNISGPGTIQVNITGFNIDGNNNGAVNRFVGILVRNCQPSTISFNNLYELLFQSGNPQTSGILVYGNSNVTVDNNTVNDFSRGGIIVNGDDGSLADPTAQISNNEVIGEGPLPVGHWAQNGIQIGFGAFGSILNNEVSDIATLDPNWSASAITIYDPSDGVTISGNNIHDCQAGMNAYYANGLTLDGNNTFTNNEFIYILAVNNLTVNNNSFIGNYEGLYLSDVAGAGLSGNTFSGNSYGIVADGACSNLMFAGNNITANDSIAVVIQPYGPSPQGVVFRGNNFSGNAFGIYNATNNMIDAAGNWWGDAEGPLVGVGSSLAPESRRPIVAGVADANENHLAGLNNNHPIIPTADNSIPAIATQTAGVSDGNSPKAPGLLTNGDYITTLVDYSPWWGANYVGDPHSAAWNWYLNISNSSSIQEAVGLVISGDVINALPGIYTGAGNRNIDFTGKNLHLLAAQGPLNTIIDCGTVDRAFHFHNGETNEAIINGFTIRNGYAVGNGGAILAENASAPYFTTCLIMNNHATGSGGAIYTDNSSMTLFKSTVIWNSAEQDAGAISINNGSPIILNSILWEDESGMGTEIVNNGGTPSITFNDITGGWQGEGNIDCYPRFCWPDTGNFNISDLSCCLNSGMGGMTMGAFELGCTGDFLPGDVNANNIVNGLDVVYFINYLKDIGPMIPAPMWRADCNGNCNVNGIDVVYLVNYLKGMGPVPIDGNCIGDGRTSMPGKNQATPNNQ